MSLLDWLMKSRTKLELAKELVATVKENVALRDRAGRLEHELFWTKATMPQWKEIAVVGPPPLVIHDPFFADKSQPVLAKDKQGNIFYAVYEKPLYDEDVPPRWMSEDSERWNLQDITHWYLPLDPP